MLCFLFSALIVALDQFFKQWVVRSIELGKEGPEIIPGILGLTRWENDGAMLNILSGQQWLLAGIAFIASVALIMILLRYNEGFWGTIGLSAVLGGSVGNLLDRIFNEGRVIDMFRTLFVNFPIFNIADIFITLGFITFLIHFIALTFKEEPDTKSVPAKNTGSVDDNSDEDSFEPESFAADIFQSPRPAADAVPSAAVSPVSAATSAVADYAPVAHITPVTPVTPAAPAAEPAVAAVPVIDYHAAVNDYAPVADYIAAATPESDIPEISFTMESLESELGSLDVDYDIDDLLREYGIEDDDTSV